MSDDTVAFRTFTKIMLRHVVVQQCMATDDPVATAEHYASLYVGAADSWIDDDAADFVKHLVLHRMEEFWQDVREDIAARVRLGGE